MIGFGVFLLVVVPIMATFISSRCTRQRRNLPIVPEIAPDDGSTTDEDWQFILQNSTKSQPVRTRQSAQSAPGGGGPNFTVFQAPLARSYLKYSLTPHSEFSSHILHGSTHHFACNILHFSYFCHQTPCIQYCSVMLTPSQSQSAC